MGKISRTEFNQLAAAAAELENLPLFIDDTARPDDRRAAHADAAPAAAPQ